MWFYLFMIHFSLTSYARSHDDWIYENFICVNELVIEVRIISCTQSFESLEPRPQISVNHSISVEDISDPCYLIQI